MTFFNVVTKKGISFTLSDFRGLHEYPFKSVDLVDFVKKIALAPILLNNRKVPDLLQVKLVLGEAKRNRKPSDGSPVDVGIDLG